MTGPEISGAIVAGGVLWGIYGSRMIPPWSSARRRPVVKAPAPAASVESDHDAFWRDMRRTGPPIR